MITIADSAYEAQYLHMLVGINYALYLQNKVIIELLKK